MSPGAKRVLRGCEVGAALAAAVLSPVPLADEVVLGPTLLGVAAVVGRDLGIPLGAMPWRVLGKTALAALAARAAVSLSVSYLPGVSAVTNALTAYALTCAYRGWADRMCRDPDQASVPSYVEIGEAILRAVVGKGRRGAARGEGKGEARASGSAGGGAAPPPSRWNESAA